MKFEIAGSRKALNYFMIEPYQKKKGGGFSLNKFYDMLERVNLQFISDMIQMGVKRTELCEKNLEERENEAVRRLKSRLEKIVPEKEWENAAETAMEYANDCCEIYFVVGMKAGAKLMFQLLNDSLKDH